MTELVRIKTTRLAGPALRYAMAGALNLNEELRWAPALDTEMLGAFNLWTDNHGCWAPDLVWDIIGPLVTQYKPWISPPADPADIFDGWDVEIYDPKTGELAVEIRGCDSWTVALCQAIVTLEIGDHVMIPTELVVP